MTEQITLNINQEPIQLPNFRGNELEAINYLKERGLIHKPHPNNHLHAGPQCGATGSAPSAASPNSTPGTVTSGGTVNCDQLVGQNTPPTTPSSTSPAATTTPTTTTPTTPSTTTPAEQKQDAASSALLGQIQSLVQRVSDLVGNIGTMFQKFEEMVLEKLKPPVAPPPTTVPTTPTPAPESVDPLAKSGKFLWKPVAEKDGKLVVLLPKSVGKAKAVAIQGPDGKTISRGKFSGIANGDRAHYRFPNPGSTYPDGSQVVITLKDGTKKSVLISDTAQRTTY